MKKMLADFQFAEADGKTTVKCTMDVHMKMGWILNPIATGQKRKSIHAMLAGAESKLKH